MSLHTKPDPPIRTSAPTATPVEARMPNDPATVASLVKQMDAWWAGLTPGQKMTMHLLGAP